MADVPSELIWLTWLLHTLNVIHLCLHFIVIISHIDVNSMVHGCTKYIEVDCDFVRERKQVMSGGLKRMEYKKIT